MLRHLRVTNFAILSDVSLELGEGMNALTGETGAGKSLIVEAVNLLRGGRASADIPRTGADEAVVEAMFEVPDDLQPRIDALLAEAGLPPASDGDVVVRRVIQRGGRSRTYVNGALTTAGLLASIGGFLVDLSGQHQHQGLVDPGRHREILDAFARADDKHATAIIAAVAASWSELTALDHRIAGLGGDEQRRAERAEFVRFQLDELRGAELVAGQDEALAAERSRLASTDQLHTGARAAEAVLYAEADSAVDRCARAQRELERLTRFDEGLGAIGRQVGEAKTLLEDAAAELRRYVDHLDGDPARLSWIEERLATIRRLTRKHGGDLASAIARQAELAAELDELDRRDQIVAQLERERAATKQRADREAAELTKIRQRAARRLERDVTAALGELGMASARLAVSIEPCPLGSGGADKVELLLAANRGEDQKPLARIASGGELSRIMLALKRVLRRADEVATYVFDEVDAGIGGATASAVGAQIRAVADQRQVLCVTHLPQIAAFADHHFHVEKGERDGRTETHVARLTASQRKEELARMLGGQATTKARAHAAELLAEAGKSRPRAQA